MRDSPLSSLLRQKGASKMLHATGHGHARFDAGDARPVPRLFSNHYALLELSRCGAREALTR